MATISFHFYDDIMEYVKDLFQMKFAVLTL